MAIIIMQDNFNDNSINAGLWNETDPNGRVAEANGRVELSNPHDVDLYQWFDDRLQSVASLSSGIVCVQAYLDWSDEGAGESRGGIFLAKDIDNWAAITSRNGNAGYVRLTIYQAGASVYNLSNTTTTNAKDFKIEYDVSATTVKFYYWDGDSWEQLGTTQTFDLGTPLYLVFTSQDGTWAANADIIYIDNAYLVSGAYTKNPPDVSIQWQPKSNIPSELRKKEVVAY